MLRLVSMMAVALTSLGCNLILGLDEGSERSGAGGAGGAGASGAAGAGAMGAGGEATTTTGMGGDPGAGGGGDGGGGGPVKGRLLMEWSFEDAPTPGWIEANLDMASVADADAVDGARVLELSSLAADAQSGEVRSAVGQSVPIGECIRLGGYSRRVTGDVFAASWILRVNGIGYEDAPASFGPSFTYSSVSCEVEADPPGVIHVFFEMATIDGGSLATMQIDDVRLEIVECVGGEAPCHL